MISHSEEKLNKILLYKAQMEKRPIIWVLQNHPVCPSYWPIKLHGLCRSTLSYTPIAEFDQMLLGAQRAQEANLT